MNWQSLGEMLYINKFDTSINSNSMLRNEFAFQEMTFSERCVYKLIQQKICEFERIVLFKNAI